MKISAVKQKRSRDRPEAKRSFRRGRLSGQVIAEMERMIQEEYRGPGLRLPKEAELAERFRVSRTVIREAMKVLEDRGLVEVRAGRGTMTGRPDAATVKASLLRLFRDQPLPTLSEMERMLELREVLEEAAAALAAIRATREDLAGIAAALSDMAASRNDEETIAADLRFHVAVAKAAHNRFFEMVIDPLTQTYVQQMKLTNSYEVGVDLHRHIFDQISKGNPVAARQAVRRLMRSTRADARKALGILSANGRLGA